MIRQIGLVVLLPKKLWNGQRDQKVLPIKEFGPHALPTSGQFTKETLGASWHWQVGTNPQQVSAISRIRSPQNQRPGLLNRFALACHSFTQAHRRVSKVQQKTCSLGEQRTSAPSILILSWRIPDEPPRLKVVAEPWKTPGFLASGGDKFNPGPEMKLDCSELLFNSFIKV